MAERDAVTTHWTRPDLSGDILRVLRAAGINPDQMTAEDLAPLDHLHGRGAEATEEVVGGLDLQPECRVLDMGCGIGGPARMIASRFGCRVTGVDLTEDFVRVAEDLTRRTGLSDLVSVCQGNALDLPFADQSFDRAYTQNVSMNIPDKPAFYGEAARVLKPGGLFAATEVLAGPGGETLFPVPWADGPATSFLETEAATREILATVGFEILHFHDLTDVFVRHAEEMREKVACEGPPLLGPHVIIGETAKEKLRTSARNLEERRTLPVHILCRRPL